MMGLYYPIQVAWREADCQSKAFSFAIGAISYSKYFDRPYDPTIGHITLSTLETIMTSLSAYNMISTCIKQNKALNSDSTSRTNDFNFMTDSWTHPQV